jgi:hypothetical protein
VQTPEEIAISQEILESYDYQVVQKSIEELSSVLLIIQEGIDAETCQIKTLQKLIESQDKLIQQFFEQKVVSIDHMANLKKDKKILQSAVNEKAENVKRLNRYLNERIMQMQVLYLKRKAIIESFSPGKLIAFRKRNNEQ